MSTVNNNGISPTPSTTLQIAFFNVPTGITLTYPSLTLPALNPGQQYTLSLPATLIFSGAYMSNLTLDPSNTVPEFDDTLNNQASYSFNI